MAISETVPCPICGTEATRVLYRQEHFAMGRCQGCGLIRQNPRLTAEHILAIDYDGAVQQGETYFDGRSDREGLAHWQSQPLAAYEAGVRAVEACRPADKPKGLWLDVGASTGQLLVAAQRAGWRVGGVEVGSGQVRLCKEVHGFDIVQGTLPQAAFPDGCAEVISWRHVLEHVHDVNADLAEAARILGPDGLLLIEVPHIGGLRYRWGRLRTALRLSTPMWSRLNIPEHLYYFSFGTLERLLRGAGFETVFRATYGKTRRKRSWVRARVDGLRDRLRVGNKMRVVARRATPS